jgi:NADP-dependent 3-hydroxy acid dehydrogenase YdfG
MNVVKFTVNYNFTEHYADGETSEWRQMLDVNILGLSICTREALRSMKERDVTDGHIIHINRLLNITVSRK